MSFKVSDEKISGFVDLDGAIDFVFEWKIFNNNF